MKTTTAKLLGGAWTVLALLALLVLPQHTHANDYLELQRHYSIYASASNPNLELFNRFSHLVVGRVVDRTYA